MSRLFRIASICLCCCLPAAAASTPSGDVQNAPSAIAVSREVLANQNLELVGDVAMARGNYAAALDAFQHMWPQTAVSLNKMGTAYHHLYAMDAALKYYELAVKLDPRYSEACNNIGAIYHGRQDFRLAEKAYKQALKFKPHSAVTYSNLGTTYFAEHNYKKGVKAYAKALELDPEVFDPERRNRVDEGSSREQRMAAAFYLAEVYASAGKNDEALECLRKALSEGFDDRKRLREDKELASLRKTPEFRELLAAQHLD